MTLAAGTTFYMLLLFLIALACYAVNSEELQGEPPIIKMGLFSAIFVACLLIGVFVLIAVDLTQGLLQDIFNLE